VGALGKKEVGRSRRVGIERRDKVVVGPTASASCGDHAHDHPEKVPLRPAGTQT
jgi:hypothetical protein